MFHLYLIKKNQTVNSKCSSIMKQVRQSKTNKISMTKTGVDKRLSVIHFKHIVPPPPTLGAVEIEFRFFFHTEFVCTCCDHVGALLPNVFENRQNISILFYIRIYRKYVEYSRILLMKPHRQLQVGSKKSNQIFQYFYIGERMIQYIELNRLLLSN